MDHPENAALPIIIRAYGILNDFLPRARRGQLVAIPYAEHETVKHVVEVVGIPHPEIEALLVNGTPVNFTARVQPGDHIDVYPPGNEPPALALRPPLVVPHFILDVHLGRLAAYLRMLGLDTRYSNDQDDPDLAQIASEENRVLLTRDIGLLKRSAVIYGAFVRATNPEAQLREIVDRYQLRRAGAILQRCLSCNGRTVWVAKEAIIDQLQPKTRRYYDMFWQCEDCGQIYWHGSHVVRMQEVIRRVFDDPQALA